LSGDSTESSARHEAAGKLLSSLPLVFTPNAGQANAATRFVARGRGYQLELQPGALQVDAVEFGRTDAPATPVRLEFAGANPEAKIQGLAPQGAKINYLIGNDPKLWRTNLTAYGQVRYTDLYPGIDLICYGAKGKQLEYDLVVAPGADPQQIRFHIGTDHSAAIGADGSLEIDGKTGPVSLAQPVFYQNVAYGKRAIFGSFVPLGKNEFGFHTADYDHTRPLIIDPAINILYSTYFGGSLDDEASSLAIDSNGNSYVTGGTNSVDMLSTANAAQPNRGAPTAGYQVTNAFVAKFDPAGVLLYGTYLGGGNLEWGGDIAVDSKGNAYVVGLSSSPDFPTTANAYAAASGYGNQLFISELSPDGSTLEYSTIYGVPGTNRSMANSSISSTDHTVTWGNMGIALSKNGGIYVSATAFSGLPTSTTAYMGSLPSNYLGYAGFVAAFDPTQVGSKQLLAATYFTAPSPSSGQNYSNSGYYGTFSYTVALDNNGNVWIGGQDQTGALPTTTNAFQKSVTLGPSCAAGTPMRSAAWLAELSPDLSTLDYASYLSGGTSSATAGSSCNEWIQGLAAGSDGSIYADGVTASASFPTTTGALQSSFPGSANVSIAQMGFVAKFAPAGASLLWSTYLGQSSNLTQIDSTPFVDAQNNVWVGGLVYGPVAQNFPLTANQLTNSSCFGYSQACGFVTGISSNGTSAVFSTTIGASTYPTFTTGVGVDGGGNVHLTGTTNASNFPLSSNAIQTQLNDGLFAFGGEGDWFYTILGSGAISSNSGALVGGNQGDNTITLTGSFQSGATCSLVSGNTTIAATQASVSTDGTQISCTFALNGAALGSYNIVVTEPDGTSVTKPNGFTVQTATGPAIWVNITGRSHLRTSTPSTMTVTYGNSGDTDALGVQLFVTLPAGVTATVLTTLLTPPNASPLQVSSVPQFVTIGSNTVLPLFVPRIAAGSSGSVQIQVTAPASVANLTISAYNWQVMATSASALESSLGTYQNGTFTTQVSRPGGGLNLNPNYLVFTLDPVSGAKCFQDIVLLGLQVATTVNPVAQDIACASQMASYLASAATALINASQPGYGADDAASDLGQLYVGAGQTALSCVEAAGGNTPAGMAVNVILTLISASIQSASLLKDCSSVAAVSNSQTKNSSVGGAVDPNDKSGPPGDGSASQYIRKQQPLTYNLAFENQPTATLPASQVIVTDQLDPTKVDLTTFSLGSISFGGNTLSPPYGATAFNTLYSLSSTLSVKVQGSINQSTGLATWTFTSIDPSTGLPPTDPTVGFLPPDSNGIVGQGSVLFNVTPKSSLTTGTQVSNTASVVFDANAAINTPTWLNTLDVDAPVSAVSALPATETATNGQANFTVNWSGTDKGSGISSYTIFVSDNGAALIPWLSGTTLTSSTYTGTTGHTYGFFSIATDAAGNIEVLKSAAEATTQVISTVTLTPTTTTLGTSNASVNVGTTVTFTAKVAPTTGTGTPTGTVTFVDGSTTLGPGTLSGGVATYMTSGLAAGSHSITAQYGGDSTYAGSNSGSLTEVVLTPTTTTLGTSNASVNVGASVTFTAKVAPTTGTGTPTGTVTFVDGSTTLGPGTLSGGTATYTTSSLAAGSHSIVAQYGGDSTYAGSNSGSLTQIVLTPTTTTLGTSNASANLGAAVTFTAKVVPTTGTGTPTGSVTFFDGSATLGPGTLSAGVATYMTSSLTAGSHSITAQYGGDSNYAGSSSGSLMQMVVAPSYTLSASPSSLTIAQGGSGSATITVTPVGGFNQSLSFTCSGLPAYATCMFSPSTLTPNGTNTAVSSTLTIATDVQTVERHDPTLPGSHRGVPLWAFAVVGLGGLLRARRRSRRIGSACMLAVGIVVLVIAGLGISGCGGKGGGAITPKGASNVTITVTGTGATQTLTISVTID
jgi:hypothetical protein